jgi:hypothetical protein
MLIFKNDEEKRSKLFYVVTLTAVVVIILIASFFLRKIVTGDPLKGSWTSTESDLTLDFDGKNCVTITTSDEFDGEEVQISMKYTLDKDSKLVSIVNYSEWFSKALEEKPEAVSEARIRTFADDMEQSYEYSIDNNELTLTEGDGGDQIIFIR